MVFFSSHPVVPVNSFHYFNKLVHRLKLTKAIFFYLEGGDHADPLFSVVGVEKNMVL